MKRKAVSGWWLVIGVWCLVAPALGATRIELIDPVKTGELRLRPTFVSCGICWGGMQDGLAIRYRKTGGEWMLEDKIQSFAETGDSRGSIFDLSEDTEYEVEVVERLNVESSGVEMLAQGKFRTWASEVPIAKTKVIDPATATYPIMISDQGTANGWIRYTLPKGVAITNISPQTTMVVGGAKYVVIDDVTIYGGGNREDTSKGQSVLVTNSVAVRFRNCDISNFGRVGIVRYDALGRRHVASDIAANNYGISGDAGIRIGKGNSEIVVERCYIHDPRGTANSWYYSHPAGQNAIVMASPDHSTVLRYNDLVGCDGHRYDDVVTSSGNFNVIGGFNRECDVYGNYMGFASDDVIEFDGGMQNTRCFDNRGEFCFVGISLQGCMVSPAYVFRNYLTGLTDSYGLCGQTIKTGSSSDTPEGPGATMYVWNNVLMGRGSGMSMRTNLIEKVCDNLLYDSHSIGNPAKGAAGSVATNNVKCGVSTDMTADPAWPIRPTPFTVSRSRFTGLKVCEGKLQPYGIADTMDLGAVVFRYAGSKPATFARVFTNSTPMVMITNKVETFDLRGDIVLTAPFSSGAMPFAKLGPGRLTLRGDTDTTTFGFATAQTISTHPTPKGYDNRFVLSEDGTMPTGGLGVFSLLQGTVALERGIARIAQTKTHTIIGGWTAAEGETEPDVALIVSNATLYCNSQFYVGERHGYRDYNTPNGPAKASIIVDRGTFCADGSKGFYLGSHDTLSGRTFNSEVELILRNGSLFRRGSSGTSLGFHVYQRRGQSARIEVNNSRLQAWQVFVGAKASEGDTTASFDLDIRNGGVFECDTFTNNTQRVANPPPSRIRIATGGILQVSDLQDNGGLSVSVDGGVIRNYNKASSRKKLDIVRPVLIGPGLTSVMVGANGLTLGAKGVSNVSNSPLTAIVAAPIADADASPGGTVILDVDAGNTLEFTVPSTYTGLTEFSGEGTCRFPSGMVVRIHADAGETRVIKGEIAGAATIVKSGEGTIQFNRKVTAARLEATGGRVVFFDDHDIAEIVEQGGIAVPAIYNGKVYADMTARGDWKIAVANGEALTVVATQTGNGGIAKSGEGRLVLTEAISFSGALAIADGEVAIDGGAGTLSMVTLSSSAKLTATPGSVIDVRELYVNGLRIPKGSVVRDGFTLQILEGELPAVATTAEWMDSVGDHRMSSLGNWSSVPASLSDGTLAINVGSSGTEMIPDAEPYVHSLAVASGSSQPFVIGAADSTLSVAGGMILGTGGVAQVKLRGRIQAPFGIDQGKASANTSISGTVVYCQSSTKPLLLDGVTISKPACLRSYGTGVTALIALAGTTNAFLGNVSLPTPQGYFNVEEGAELGFYGGVNASWGHKKSGAGILRIANQPYTCNYQLHVGGGKVVFDAEGCTFGGRYHTEGFVADGSTKGVEFLRSGCLANNETSFTIGSDTPVEVEFHATTQRIGRIRFPLNNSAAVLHGDYPAMLEITGGVRKKMDPQQVAKVMMMTNAIQVTGGLGIAFRGDLAGGTNATYLGYNESFVLYGRDFESCGDLLVSGGTLELAANASWRHGTNFIVRGNGVLRFNGDNQVDEEFAVLKLSDAGKLWIPQGVRVRVLGVMLEESGQSHWASPGVHTAADGDSLGGRILGGGSLMVVRGSDETAFTPSGWSEPLLVSNEWLISRGLVAADDPPSVFAARLSETNGNGHPRYEAYILGMEPDLPLEEQLQVTIDGFDEDGVPIIGYRPTPLIGSRVLSELYGKVTLNPVEKWAKVSDANRKEVRFFRLVIGVHE